MDIAVILAAGMGTRMQSKLIKVLHPILGKPMVQWSIDTAAEAGFRSLVVVGNQEDKVRTALSDANVSFARQSIPKGTGHAVQCALQELKNLNAKRVLVFFGDTPLFRPETLQKLKGFHLEHRFEVTFVTATVEDAGSYGRLIRDEQGRAQKIVEASNATLEELAVCEINTGAAMFEMAWLEKHLPNFLTHPPKDEVYLTDALELAAQEGKAGAMILEDATEADGVNNRIDLAKATRILQNRIVKQHMLNGVSFADPFSVTVEPSVVIAQDSWIDRGVVLKGTTHVATNVSIGAYSVLEDTVVDESVKIDSHSNLKGAKVGYASSVGPFARLREGSHLESNTKVGNFVEMKKTTLGKGAKASHLSYLGDAKVGQNANIGAGTITCNYDGYNKHMTVIDDGAFIGSNTALVAPVHIEEGAVVGAGSVITQNVPSNSISITRAPQEIFEQAAVRFRGKAKQIKQTKAKDN